MQKKQQVPTDLQFGIQLVSMNAIEISTNNV